MYKFKIIKTFILMVFLMLPNFALAALSDFEFWFESGTTKIRQDMITKSQPNWSIKSARNEFEPFQLVLKNVSTDTLNDIDVEISDFSGAAGTISSDNVTIFKEHYLNITNLSTVDGQLGEWPDALLPKVDAYYHENRTTFPFDISAGRIQPVWFDVFVPANTTPGDYSATVTVTENAVTIFTGTINLTVWNFTLPATSSIPSSFGNSIGVWAGFSGAEWVAPDLMQDQMRWFIRAGLRHRITLSAYPITVGTYDSVSKSYSGFSNTRNTYSLNGYLDGTSGDVEYGNSKITSLGQDLSSVYTTNVSLSSAPYYSYCLDTSQTEPPQAYKDQLTALVSTYNNNLTPTQKETMFFLIIDEAGGGEVGCGSKNPILDYNTAKWGADLVHSFGLKTKATNRRKDELLNIAVTPFRNDYFDRWSVGWTILVGRDWTGSINRIAEYATDIANGAQLWWYHGCMEGSCGSTGNSSFNGNMNYYVDYPAMRSRISPWLNFKYEVQGESLWSVSSGFSKQAGFSGDPYNSIWSTNYAKNGDGMLFYPGVVDTVAAGLPTIAGRGLNTPSIGGIHNIPIESIRLKMIREGYEDYEYLKKLKDLGDEDYAQTQISNIATNTYTFSEDENLMYIAREALANRILGIPVDMVSPSAPTGLGVM